MRPLPPFQRVADSPTVKYYVDWTSFEPYLEEAPRATAGAVDEELLELLGIKADLELRVDEANPEPADIDWQAEAWRLMEFHRSNLSLHKEVKAKGAASVLVEKPVSGVKSSHVRLLLGEGARVNVVLLSPPSARGLHTLTLDVEVEPNADAALLLIVHDSLEAPGFIAQRATVGSGARLTQLTVVGRGYTSYVELSYRIREGGALRLMGALAAPRRSTVALVSNASVEGAKAAAEIDVRGFARGGTLVHKGIAKVCSGADGSSLRFSSSLTPLEEGSRVYAAPMPEVYSNSAAEVSHSASHAPLNEDELFYLRARGFDERDALKLVIEGSYKRLLDVFPGAEAVSRLLPIIVQSLTTDI